MNNTSTKIYKFIVLHNVEKGYPPTIREIQVAVGLLSSSTAMGHVQRLAKKGLVTFTAGSPRTIRAVQQSAQSNDVKVINTLDDIPIEIEWEGRRYVLDPTMR